MVGHSAPLALAALQKVAEGHMGKKLLKCVHFLMYLHMVH